VTSSSIISRKNKALLLPLQTVQSLFPSVPTLQHNGDRYAVLPHDTPTQFKLRAFGIEAPAPISYYGDWTSSDGKIPFAAQKHTAELASSYQRFYVLNDMGTGKTRSGLLAWRFLYRSGSAGKLLVVAPLSTLEFTWAREILLTMPEMKISVLHGSNPRKRLHLLAADADIFIINHEGLPTIVEELHARADIDCLIIDELAVYRGGGKRARQMRAFAERFVWIWGMTGTPMPNAPTDVWAQCRIITPQTVPRKKTHARDALMVKLSQYHWVPRDGAVQRALGWMNPHIRYSLDDVVELPQAIYRTLDIDLSEQQSQVYRQMASSFAALVENKRITAANAGVALGKLLQVACGYVYHNNPEYVVLDSESRQTLLLELIEQAPYKVIVFAPWRHLLANLSALLINNKIEHACVHGGITKRARDDILGDFQTTPRYRVLLAHPVCLHHGVTLTAASTVIWYSPIPSLAVYEQANARIRRSGQENKQQFLHIQATVSEQKVYAMLRAKQRMQNEFLELLTMSINGNTDHDTDERADTN
jgi:SNF2 family DNA or RNA helicase